jgi:hypothetical protein
MTGGACIYPEIPVPESGTRAEKVAAMSQALAGQGHAMVAGLDGRPD